MIPTPEPIIGNPEIPMLVQKMRAGDVDAFEQIVLGHMQLAQQMAANWAVRLKTSVEDVEAEAIYLLTLAVENFKTKESHDEISPYINVYVNKGLLRFGYKRRLVKAPPEVLREKKIGRSGLLLQFEEGWLSPDFEDNLLVDHREKAEKTCREMLSTLDEVIENDRERQFVALRLRGYSNEEVSTIMGVSLSTLFRLRHGLESRFNKEFFSCESSNTSALQHSNSIDPVEMTITSVISLTQKLHETVRPNRWQ